ncbi:Hyaluronidase-1 [Holothuria leucospilota]|uniref:Hyaluronidase n=1 Tax=Holothuria leucospilota TaxID=206669 RepID=A0A9Q1BDM7_HOLLE|nr:Hyaluronidase-1 [Holothuria leucospilota]
MKSTLRLAKDLRPNARWGFYHFPYCYNNKDPAYCTQEAVLTNDNITWLFESSTALYPSIYMHESQERKDDFVHAIVGEAFRLRNKSRNPFVDVYPYTRYVYTDSFAFLTKKDLNNTVLQSAQMGSSGVVFWGAGYDTHSVSLCLELQSYINSTLGPFVKNLIDATVLCSDEICSGNGRCVGKILECAGHLKQRERVNELDVNMRDGYERWQQTLMPCSCQCYKGWKGSFCDQFEY